MIQKFKLLSFSIFFVLSLTGVSFATPNAAFANHCSDDPNDDSCHICPNDAPNYPICDCALAGLDSFEGSCVPYCETWELRNGYGYCYTPACPTGQTRDPVTHICNYPACTNGATNPPECDNVDCENGAINYDECDVCPDGEEMYLGQCINECPGGTLRNEEGDCMCMNGAGNPPVCDDYLCHDPAANNQGELLPCTFDAPDCCSMNSLDANGNPPLNGDNNCPNPPDTQSDPSICEYCNEQSEEPACKVGYCDDQGALNQDPGGAQCRTNHPGKNCYKENFFCNYQDLYYCDDQDALFPPSEDLFGCTARLKPGTSQRCVVNNPAKCTYPEYGYCNDARAGNYDQNGDECRIAHPFPETCAPDNNECSYTYCTIGFSLDIECPSGFKFKTPDDISYWYSYQYSPQDPYNESCVGFSYDETEYIKHYFEQLFCGEGQNVACEGGFCGSIDWCPADGVQTDPTQCVDVCPDSNHPGIQTSESQCGNANLCLNLGNVPPPVGYYYNSQTRYCYPCQGGVCNPVNGVCGTATTSNYAANINGTRACTTGLKTSVTLNNTIFNWSCIGSQGGTDMGCQANLICDAGKSYCENKGICSDKCYLPNECEDVNPNICVFNGSVSLNANLAVTPIVDRDGTCVIDIGKTSEVFDAFDNDTHCVLSSQDAVINEFDPADLTADGEGLTRYSMENIKKDMTYTLKCYNGDLPETENGYEKSVGSCRLNLRTKEAN